MTVRELCRRALTALGVVAAIAVVGCATVDPAAVAVQTREKSIAVVSALGPDLQLSWVGTTIFNNEFGARSVPDWRIDEVAADKAIEVLRATQRYREVVAIKGVSRKADEVPALPAGTDSDFLVLIEPAGHGDPIWGTNQSFPGVGVAQRTFMGLPPQARGHIGLRIELFDVRAGRSVGSTAEFTHWATDVRLTSGGGASWSKTPVPQLTDAAVDELKPTMLRKLSEVVEAQLQQLGLR